MAARPTEVAGLGFQGAIPPGGSWTASKPFDSLMYPSLSLALWADVQGVQLGTLQGGALECVSDIPWNSGALAAGGHGFVRSLPARYVKTTIRNPGPATANVRLYVIAGTSQVEPWQSQGDRAAAPATVQEPVSARLFHESNGGPKRVYSANLAIGGRRTVFCQASTYNDDAYVSFEESITGDDWTPIAGAGLTLLAGASPVSHQFEAQGRHIRAVIVPDGDDVTALPCVTLDVLAK